MKLAGILFVGNFLSGYNQTSRNPCEELAARFARLGVATITSSSCRNRVWRLADMLSTAWWHRNRYEVAIVDVFSGQAFCWAEATCLVLRRLGRPYVLALHGGNLPEFARKHPDRVRSILTKASAVTSPSDYLQNELIHFRNDIALLRNPIDLAQYRFHLRKRPEPKLVWLRAFHEIYNPVLAVQVLAKLRQDYPMAELLMVGPDKGDGSLGRVRLAAEQYNIQHALHVVPGVDKSEVPTMLQKGDIFINTTNVDNTPVSVVEAMACGLCVVSTDVGGLKYLLTHEQNALLVPPNAADAMTSQVRRLLESPDLAQVISLASGDFVQSYDWATVRPCWENLLSKVVSDRRAV